MTCICGFEAGDRVTMISGFEKEDGSDPERLHGTVEAWEHGCGHIVAWDEMPTVTALPNPNVQHDRLPS